MSDNPWNWSEEEKTRADKALKVANAIKQYRSAGRLGMGDKAASDAMASSGGLDKKTATTLGRYKQFKETTGGDPNWQGPMMVNSGEREDPQNSREEVAERARKFHASDRDGKGQMWAEQKQKVERLKEGFYDDLTEDEDRPQRRLDPSAALSASMKRKRG